MNKLMVAAVAGAVALGVYAETIQEGLSEDLTNKIFVSPDGTGDGSDPSKPAALSNAIFQNAPEGYTVVALPGTYTITEQLTLVNGDNKAISLEGRAKDAETTVFTGTIAPMLDIKGSTLKGVTFSDVASSGNIVNSNKGKVLDCVFTNCTITGKLFYNSTTAGAIVSNCVFSSCTANGVMYDEVQNANSLFLDCVIENCTGTGGGYGGVFRRGTVYRCVVRNYTVSCEEMNIYAPMYDCLIDGVVGKVTRDTTTHNCTIINCKGVIYNNDGAQNNNIYYNNKSGTAANAGPATLRGTLNNCWIETGVTGGTRSKCIEGTDPKMDADGKLLAGSPCIDNGDNSSVAASRTIDLFGNPRIYNSTVDIGCYEKNGYGAGEVFFTADPVQAAGAVGESVELGVQYRADEGSTVTATFDFGDGTDPVVIVYDGLGGSVPTATTVTHTYTFGGAFAVTASAVFSSGADPVVMTFPARYLVQNVAEGDVYVSETGSDANLGLSPESAKRTVTSAVTAVYPGSKVIIKNGTYEILTETVIDKQTVVEGESRDGVVLTGASECRIFTVNNSQTVLRNFTVNGVTNAVKSAGAVIRLQQGILENVAFLACRDVNGGVAIVDVNSQKTTAIVTNCLFRACYGSNIVDAGNSQNPQVFDSQFLSCSGKTYGSIVRGCQLYRCRFVGCSGDSNNFIYSRLYDCLLADFVDGAKIRESNTYNCTIVNGGTAAVFQTGGWHVNDIIWGNKSQVNAGTLSYCLVDNAAAGNLGTGCITGADAVLKLNGEYVPKFGCSALGAGRIFSDEDGKTFDTGSFPNAAKRAVDLYGQPRYREKKRGRWLDIGCCQGSLDAGILIILR